MYYTCYSDLRAKHSDDYILVYIMNTENPKRKEQEILSSKIFSGIHY